MEDKTHVIGILSPQEWGLIPADVASDQAFAELGVSPAELDRRIRGATYRWLPRQFDEQIGAFHGFYSALDKRFEPPQTVNLIAPWQCLAAYDRYHDAASLVRARRAADWFYARFVESHPMSVVSGGVRERLPDGDLWTKFAAEFVLLTLGLYRRTAEAAYLDRARQSAAFLIQSARHGFAPRYDLRASEWRLRGWQSFGRVIEAFLALSDVTGEVTWKTHALRWGDFGRSLLAADGSFYLIDDEYFNTDLAADELRAMAFLYEQTGKVEFWSTAVRFATWLLKQQRADGAWPMTIDRDGNVVVATVGPGDVPNIAISLLRMHHISGEAHYLEAAARAFRYSLSVQALPSSEKPYVDDPNVQWGFWSWDPYYDYTLSGDQATHHVRGFMFALDYFSAVLKSKSP